MLALGLLMVTAGLVLLTGVWLDQVPAELSLAGSVLIATAYVGALAARTGARPLPLAATALVVTSAVGFVDSEPLRTGTAVLTTVVAAVLAVMVTEPSVRTLHAVREVVIAMSVAAIGGMAALGFSPLLSQTRYEYVTLALALVTALAFVFRLGAGFHGLGRRGLVIVLVGSAVVAVSLAYTELLRRYGSEGMLEQAATALGWTRDVFGAAPRPLEVLLGIPALMWGAHMRARRRQGWWVCAFGVAATTPVGHGLVNPAYSMGEALLMQGYSLALGMLIGYAVIRADLVLTGSRGRRARRAEEAAALRPEPPRYRPLQ